MVFLYCIASSNHGSVVITGSLRVHKCDRPVPLFFYSDFDVWAERVMGMETQNPQLISHLGDFWEEIVFLKELVKFGKIRNIKDLM